MELLRPNRLDDRVIEGLGDAARDGDSEEDDERHATHGQDRDGGSRVHLIQKLTKFATVTAHTP